jgi:hypothetical protein
MHNSTKTTNSTKPTATGSTGPNPANKPQIHNSTKQPASSPRYHQVLPSQSHTTLIASLLSPIQNILAAIDAQYHADRMKAIVDRYIDFTECRELFAKQTSELARAKHINAFQHDFIDLVQQPGSFAILLGSTRSIYVVATQLNKAVLDEKFTITSTSLEKAISSLATIALVFLSHFSALYRYIDFANFRDFNALYRRLFTFLKIEDDADGSKFAAAPPASANFGSEWAQSQSYDLRQFVDVLNAPILTKLEAKLVHHFMQVYKDEFNQNAGHLNHLNLVVPKTTETPATTPTTLTTPATTTTPTTTPTKSTQSKPIQIQSRDKQREEWRFLQLPICPTFQETSVLFPYEEEPTNENTHSNDNSTAVEVPQRPIYKASPISLQNSPFNILTLVSDLDLALGSICIVLSSFLERAAPHKESVLAYGADRIIVPIFNALPTLSTFTTASFLKLTHQVFDYRVVLPRQLHVQLPNILEQTSDYLFSLVKFPFLLESPLLSFTAGPEGFKSLGGVVIFLTHLSQLTIPLARAMSVINLQFFASRIWLYTAWALRAHELNDDMYDVRLLDIRVKTTREELDNIGYTDFLSRIDPFSLYYPDHNESQEDTSDQHRSRPNEVEVFPPISAHDLPFEAFQKASQANLDLLPILPRFATTPSTTPSTDNNNNNNNNHNDSFSSSYYDFDNESVKSIPESKFVFGPRSSTRPSTHYFPHSPSLSIRVLPDTTPRPIINGFTRPSLIIIAPNHYSSGQTRVLQSIVTFITVIKRLVQKNLRIPTTEHHARVINTALQSCAHQVVSPDFLNLLYTVCNLYYIPFTQVMSTIMSFVQYGFVHPAILPLALFTETALTTKSCEPLPIDDISVITSTITNEVSRTSEGALKTFIFNTPYFELLQSITATLFHTMGRHAYALSFPSMGALIEQTSPNPLTNALPHTHIAPVSVPGTSLFQQLNPQYRSDFISTYHYNRRISPPSSIRSAFLDIHRVHTKYHTAHAVATGFNLLNYELLRALLSPFGSSIYMSGFDQNFIPRIAAPSPDPHLLCSEQLLFPLLLTAKYNFAGTLWQALSTFTPVNEQHQFEARFPSFVVSTIDYITRFTILLRLPLVFEHTPYRYADGQLHQGGFQYDTGLYTLSNVLHMSRYVPHYYSTPFLNGLPSSVRTTLFGLYTDALTRIIHSFCFLPRHDVTVSERIAIDSNLKILPQVSFFSQGLGTISRSQITQKHTNPRIKDPKAPGGFILGVETDGKNPAAVVQHCIELFIDLLLHPTAYAVIKGVNFYVPPEETQVYQDDIYTIMMNDSLRGLFIEQDQISLRQLQPEAQPKQVFQPLQSTRFRSNQISTIIQPYTVYCSRDFDFGLLLDEFARYGLYFVGLSIPFEVWKYIFQSTDTLSERLEKLIALQARLPQRYNEIPTFQATRRFDGQQYSQNKDLSNLSLQSLIHDHLQNLNSSPSNRYPNITLQHHKHLFPSQHALQIDVICDKIDWLKQNAQKGGIDLDQLQNTLSPLHHAFLNQELLQRAEIRSNNHQEQINRTLAAQQKTTFSPLAPPMTNNHLIPQNFPLVLATHPHLSFYYRNQNHDELAFSYKIFSSRSLLQDDKSIAIQVSCQETWYTRTSLIPTQQSSVLFYNEKLSKTAQALKPYFVRLAHAAIASRELREKRIPALTHKAEWENDNQPENPQGDKIDNEAEIETVEQIAHEGQTDEKVEKKHDEINESDRVDLNENVSGEPIQQRSCLFAFPEAMKLLREVPPDLNEVPVLVTAHPFISTVIKSLDNNKIIFPSTSYEAWSKENKRHQDDTSRNNSINDQDDPTQINSAPPQAEPSSSTPSLHCPVPQYPKALSKYTIIPREFHQTHAGNRTSTLCQNFVHLESYINFFGHIMAVLSSNFHFYSGPTGQSELLAKSSSSLIEILVPLALEYKPAGGPLPDDDESFIPTQTVSTSIEDIEKAILQFEADEQQQQ